jgi:hypothetical protein
MSRGTLSFVAVVFALALAAALPAGALAGEAAYQDAATGLLARTHAGPPAAASLQSSLASRPRGARRVHHARAAAGALRAVPSLAAPAARAAGASLLTNFNGVSSLDSAVTNFGLEFEPPDQGLCVGNGFVVEMVNSAYTVYDESGKALAGPFNVNGPFGEGLTEFTSDPRCYYEPVHHTWIATILAIGRGEESSTLDIAVNTSGDPRTPWTDYKLDTTDTPKHGGKGKECPCFGDQPKLGIDASNLYVTTDEFSILGPQFNGDQLYAFALKDLFAEAETVHFAHFAGLKIAGAFASSVQPAITSEPAPAEYFMQSIDPTETSGNSIGVWALSGAKNVAKGGKPVLSSTVLPSEPFAIPVPAEQKGTATPIEAGDDRMQQTQFTGGRLWGALDTSVEVPGESQTRDGAAWFSAEPSLRNGVLGPKTQLVQQGYVAQPGAFFLYPALALTPSGHGAMAGTLTSAKRFPSAAYATIEPGGAIFTPIAVAAAGTTNYNPEAERWGDYSWAIADPAGKSVWLATEYVPPKSSQTPDGLRDWGTRVFQVPTG